MYLIRTETGIMSSQAVDLVVILVLMLTNPSLGEQYENTCIQKKHYSETVISYFETSLRGRSVTMDRCKELKNDVVEYRGLPYGDFGQEFQRLGSLSAPRNKTMYASDHNKPCPQRRMPLDPSMASTIYNRWKAIGNFTMDSSPTGECPWINLFVPKTEAIHRDKMAVMIFVHGESFDVGTGNAYDGSVLASYGEVIVITVNYRLGVLGFLSTEDNNAKGNYAIRDLIAVLVWVKENIERFNGDASRVTLFGHGHGAALVNLLLVSKTDQGADALFHNVILQSGSALSTWATSIDPLRCARKLAIHMKCPENDYELLVKCLKSKAVDELVRAHVTVPKYFTCFGPSIGKDDTFPAARSVEDLFELNGRQYSSKKIMLGITTKEAYSFFKQKEIVDGMLEIDKKRMLRTYVQNVFDYNRQKIYDVLDHEYTRWDLPRDNRSRLDELMNLISDGQFKAPLIKMAQILSKSADTYLYSFGYSTFSEDFPGWTRGVHGDELPYVFGAPLVGGISPFPSNYNEREVELSKYMMRLWTNFAKTGDPNKQSGAGTRFHNYNTSLYWAKYNVSSQAYIQIDEHGSRLSEFYRAKELALWLHLLPKLNQQCPTDTKESHDLDNADDLSTFDEHQRLKNKFFLFPLPPPMPPNSPMPPVHPNDDDKAHQKPTTKPSLDTMEITEEETSYQSPTMEAPISGRVESAEDGEPIPLSVTLVIGCVLLLINLLIFAGIYYQRERIKKIRSRNSANTNGGGTLVDNRTMEQNNTRDAPYEGAGLVTSPDGKPYTKASNLNHKPVSDNPPMYSSLGKPQKTGGYSYSALPQKSSSPMHTHNPRQFPAHVRPDGAAVHGSLPGHGANSIPRAHNADRSPKNELRSKSLPRHNHQLTSNNAITIV